MSTDVTMQELELETAELLPARETLNNCGQSAAAIRRQLQLHQWQYNGNGDGNVHSPAAASWSLAVTATLDGNLDGNTLILAPARLARCLPCITRGGRAAGKGGPPGHPGGPPACGPARARRPVPS